MAAHADLPHPLLVPLDADVKQQCAIVLSVLKKLPSYKNFNRPVDWQKLQLFDYREKIKQPMDLGTAEKKLNSGRYERLEDFAYDVRLVCKNALYYNGTDQDIGRQARTLCNTFEQELEKFWIDCQNKELADKRRDEEEKAMLKEWGQARGRVETDIARKKEHLGVATNFQKARGWVRTNWKTKRSNPRRP